MLKFDISNVKGSEKTLLKMIIEKQNWIDCGEQHSKAKIVWNQRKQDKCSKYSINRPRLQISNKIKGIATISQKASTKQCLSTFALFYPEINEIYPETYIYPQDRNLLYSKNLNLFIAKPSNGSEGKGIFFPNSMNDLVKKAGLEQLVIQKYIDNPMLLDNKKFDLRFYILIHKLNPYICYLNKEGLVRICVDAYEKNNKNQFAHLTNYAINCENSNYVPCSNDFINDNQSNKQSFSAFRQTLQKNGQDDQILFQNIENLIAQFMKAIYPFILYHSKSDKSEQSQNFCIIGLDIILNSEGQPFILEMNSSPSLQITQYKNNKEEISPFDFYVKELVVTDAILIATNKKEWNDTSYKLLSDEYQLVNNSVLELLNLFWYCGKGMKTLSCSQFCKISNFSGMLNDNLQRVEYQILFCKFQVQRINFYQFLELIIAIQKRMNIQLHNLLEMIRI
ncbi:unnamed protein product [Paramecium sonneborni]|uniref:Tubulin-tyrosine ligase family protein n=1 Tax=Paramecium sonneborni TaxID=65129 RepID=A0A8S1QA97_9CILI|nr:unnamed protein product [Paramecium sonneborni]